MNDMSARGDPTILYIRGLPVIPDRKAAEIEERRAEARKGQAGADSVMAAPREKQRLALIRDLLMLVDLERARQTSSLEDFFNLLRGLDRP